MKIAVINGPNLNFLGIREPNIYGYETYEDLKTQVQNKVDSLNVECPVEDRIHLNFFQSNGEGAIIDFLQQCYDEKVGGILINPGAYTHYSYAIRDAIASISIPTVEIHLSDIHAREGFRSQSVVEDVCIHQICGKKIMGYLEGIDYLVEYCSRKGNENE